MQSPTCAKHPRQKPHRRRDPDYAIPTGICDYLDTRGTEEVTAGPPYFGIRPEPLDFGGKLPPHSIPGCFTGDDSDLHAC
jgi:hypothetical protein